MNMFRTSLFLFRRDLRLEDNTGLNFALQNSKTVICAFILTPEQIENNAFRSDHCLRFMIESLQDLASDLKKHKGKLYLFQGEPEKVVRQCIKTLGIDALIVNCDYTPYSQKRDRRLKTVCGKNKVAFHSFDDALLHPPEDTLKKDGTPYTVFTPYFRNACKEKVLPPMPTPKGAYFKGNIALAKDSAILERLNVPKSVVNELKGGRKEGLKMLANLPKQGSSHLSPYLKFNVISPREAYAAIAKKLGSHHELIRSLYWRDFFTGIAFFFPHVFKGAFRPKFDKIAWVYDKKIFRRWCEGKTGFPIVDAGMREMNATGFMNNRLRMIAASFLVKDLHIDWRWGEKYFAQTLIDYDPAVNNGNWQWVASTGSDAQPYFRTFNPWTQQKKFDSECEYIKKWIPELKDLSPQEIHAWYKQKSLSTYPFPMIDHEKEVKKALRLYRSVS